ncbi:hypothetical protein E4U09_004792 [Claviceps aff. purpurea]|uniref:Uncharacterized protein n=1 Tax=Claviceps aff. purpurea TaxID=1967640 RepID=A0A9P7QF85_9HYPO|nr:hypothetical protein E4U09_004792 [Claviceps aff. purpurea]
MARKHQGRSVLVQYEPQTTFGMADTQSVINEWHLDTYGYGITERPLLTPEATPPPDEDNHAPIQTSSDSDAQHMSTNNPQQQGTDRHSSTEDQGTDSTSSSSIVPQGHETLTEHTFSGHTF